MTKLHILVVFNGSNNKPSKMISFQFIQ